MNENIYKNISDLYSHLMKFIDYKKWANYIFKLSKELNCKEIYSLELASGNCSLAKHLQNKFHFYVATDLSFNMLQNAPPNVKNKVNCNFLYTPFKKKFNFIFSCFDSVNYLTSKKDFSKMLDEVANILDDNGIFTFDVSMENNSLKYQKYLNRNGIYNGIKYKQISHYNPKTKFHKNIFLLELENGEKIEEIHLQKIYKFEEYFEIFSKSKFYVANCFNSFTFNNADNQTERIQFVLKKKRRDANF